MAISGMLDLILHPPPPKIDCIVTAVYDRFTITAWGFHMAYSLPDDHFVDVQVAYVDAHGHPASVDGPVAWATSNTDIANVAADATDSTKARVTPGATLGTAQITATADADLGTGVRTLLTSFDVTVVGGEAVAGTISPVGDPQPIVAVGPATEA